MVIANSTWVRPAQALIYSESGEVRYFPPINRGRLPRALTFGDHQDWRHHESGQQCRTEEQQMINPFELPEHIQEQESYLITSENENFHIDDPPEEYTSFESEYSRHSMARDVSSYSCLDQEAPSMSTPTEQYMNNVLKRKGFSHRSVLSSKQPCYSSASDTQNGCVSPLLQSDSGPHLSLDDLVELYAKKLKAARKVRLSNADVGDKDDVNTKKGHAQEYEAPNKFSTDRIICDEVKSSTLRDQHSSFNSQNQNGVSNCKSMQLLAFDIHLFLDKLDDIYLGEEKKLECEDWLCVSSEELESILLGCCKEAIEVVMIE